MPYIQARLSVNTDDTQKENLQTKLSKAVSASLSKPSAYIMTEIQDNCNLYMAERKLDKCAYISISSLGSISKNSCQTLTKAICDILQNDFEINAQNVYITYHPTDLWGWNNMMF